VPDPVSRFFSCDFFPPKAETICYIDLIRLLPELNVLLQCLIAAGIVSSSESAIPSWYAGMVRVAAMLQGFRAFFGLSVYQVTPRLQKLRQPIWDQRSPLF
jgi:hypothetical protein